jgi:hypothetical protein
MMSTNNDLTDRCSGYVIACHYVFEASIHLVMITVCGSCQSELCCWQRLIFKKCYLNLYTGVLMFA